MCLKYRLFRVMATGHWISIQRSGSVPVVSVRLKLQQVRKYTTPKLLSLNGPAKIKPLTMGLCYQTRLGFTRWAENTRYTLDPLTPSNELAQYNKTTSIALCVKITNLSLQ
jgi:hypothetical protein